MVHNIYNNGAKAFILGKRMKGMDKGDEEQRKEGGSFCACKVGKWLWRELGRWSWLESGMLEFEIMARLQLLI